MFGALAASGVLPYRREAFERGRRATRGAAPMRACGALRARGRWSTRCAPPGAAGDAAPRRPRGRRVARIRRRRSLRGGGSHAVATASRGRRTRAGRQISSRWAVARVAEFQDERYAELYDRRVARIAAAERAADPAARARPRTDARDGALPRAVDGVRRHRARRRTSSAARAASRACARKWRPRTATSCASSITSSPACPSSRRCCRPHSRGARIAWDRRAAAPRQAAARVRAAPAQRQHRRLRRAAGAREPQGHAAPRLALRGRAGGDRALAGWRSSARRRPDWQCAYELALCGRLVKGYGATNERGKHNLAHIVGAPGRGRRVRDTRGPRRGDPAGARGGAGGRGRAGARPGAGAHGAPARPVVAQPIRWMARPTAPAAQGRVVSPTGGPRARRQRSESAAQPMSIGRRGRARACRRRAVRRGRLRAGGSRARSRTAWSRRISSGTTPMA